MTMTEKKLIAVQIGKVVAPDPRQVGKDTLEPPGIHSLSKSLFLIILLQKNYVDLTREQLDH